MNNQNDLPLGNDIAARFVPKIVGLMVYLGSLCFVFTLFMFYATHSWEMQLATDLSIEIPTFSGTSSSVLESRVLHLLNRTPGIQEAKVIPQNEMANLFQSLLGEKMNTDLLSLPILIDVTLKEKDTADIKTLATHLSHISPHIQVIDHRQWQGQVSNLIQTSVLLALLISCLIFFAALATTTFATRTSLLIHRQIIEVLSLIGATNSYIAKQFQMNALKQGLISGTLGSLFAFLTFFGISLLFDKSGFPFIISSAFFFQAICIFIVAPIFTAFAMMLVTRLAVMKVLRS